MRVAAAAGKEGGRRERKAGSQETGQRREGEKTGKKVRGAEAEGERTADGPAS